VADARLRTWLVERFRGTVVQDVVVGWCYAVPRLCSLGSVWRFVDLGEQPAHPWCSGGIRAVAS
jgi:hypothetical protein